MTRPKWACMALLLFLCLGVSSAGRVTVVDNDKPEKFVLGGHIGWNPGFIGGIIEGALGHKSPQTLPTPPPSPDETSIAGATEEGYVGGRGGGYGSGQVGGISGGGGGGSFGKGGGGGWGGGGGSGGFGKGGGWGGGGGGGGRDRHRGGDDYGDQSGVEGGCRYCPRGGDDCGDQSGCDSGDQSGSDSGDQSSGSDCGDHSAGDSRGQAGSPSTVVPGFTIPGFEIGGMIGGEIGIGTSGGLYCKPIKCRGNNCRGVRLYFENSNDPKMAGSNGQKQNMKHEEEDKHSMNTLAASEPMDTRDTGIRPPADMDPPSPPLNVAAEPEPVDPLKQESVVPKPSP